MVNLKKKKCNLHVITNFQNNNFVSCPRSLLERKTKQEVRILLGAQSVLRFLCSVVLCNTTPCSILSYGPTTCLINFQGGKFILKKSPRYLRKSTVYCPVHTNLTLASIMRQTGRFKMSSQLLLDLPTGLFNSGFPTKNMQAFPISFVHSTRSDNLTHSP